MLVLADNSHSDNKSNSSPKRDANNILASMFNSLDDDLDMTLGIPGAGKGKGGIESAGLSDYAQHALREVCQEEWVREKFLKNPKILFTDSNLLDKMLSGKQARQLVELICLQESSNLGVDEDEEEDDQEQQIAEVLQNMDQWSLRVSWLQLQLMLEQAQASGSTSTLNNLQEKIATATIGVFQQQANRKVSVSVSHGQSQNATWLEMEKDGIWLVAPLIAKLPNAVQGRVLNEAGEELETGNSFWTAKNAQERERELQKSTLLLANQPFLSLVSTCLRGQDEQRECLLKSLLEQLEKFVTNAKDQERGLFTDEKLKFMMQEPLRLRLSLVGGMIDTIQRNTSLVQEWSLLLIQLVSHEVVDVNNNVELFTVVLDMLSVLLHGTLVSENSEKGEDSKKNIYTGLVKKLKKEIGERFSVSIDHIRQLLPLPKVQCEIIVCEPYTDKNHKNSSGTEKHERKQGLQINKKEKVNPWDLIEGLKNQGVLSLATFGAIKMERKPLEYEEQHRLLMYHTHTLKKPANYFLDPPPLPPEDLPPPEKQEVDKKEPGESELSKVLGEASKKPGGKKKRRQNPRLTPNTPTQYVPNQGPMFPRNDPPYGPNWNTPYNQPPQTNMFPQPIPPGGPRFGNRTLEAKNYLNTFLRARNQPGPGFMQTPPNPAYDPDAMRVRAPHHVALRQRLLNPNLHRSMSDDGQMYPQPSMGPANGPGPNYQPMSTPTGANYQGGNYQSMAGGNPSATPGMMDTGPPMPMTNQPGFNQGYQSSNQNMGNMMPQQHSSSGYMVQQHQNQNHFPASSRFSGGISPGAGGAMQGNAMSNMGGMASVGMSGGSMQTYNQMGPQTAQPTAQGNYMPNMQSQRMHQMQQQRQMMAMQQQQQQQQQPPQQQGHNISPQNSAIYSLQRQMSGGGNPSTGQYNSYHQFN